MYGICQDFHAKVKRQVTISFLFAGNTLSLGFNKIYNVHTFFCLQKITIITMSRSFLVLPPNHEVGERILGIFTFLGQSCNTRYNNDKTY